MPSLLTRQVKPYTLDALGENVDDAESDFDDYFERENDVTSVPKLLGWIKGYRGPLVPQVLRRITGNGDQAILLAQILYWFDLGEDDELRARARYDGEIFLAKTHAELADEVGMLPRRVKDCLAALKEKNLILIEPHKSKYHGGKCVSFIQPVVQTLKQAAEKAIADSL